MLQTSPVSTSPIDAWNIFLLCMVALSVATERVTEMVKQWIGPTLSGWLSAEHYTGAVQFIAILSGIFVTALSGRNPLGIPEFEAFKWGKPENWLAWVVTGILVSGGSAFWNHLLDILQAAKVAKEQALQLAPAAPSPAPTDGN
jgi:drug/metabolite transporter (DMT)-like permease